MIKLKYCALNYEYQCGYRAYSIGQLHCMVCGFRCPMAPLVHDHSWLVIICILLFEVLLLLVAASSDDDVYEENITLSTYKCKQMTYLAYQVS